MEFSTRNNTKIIVLFNGKKEKNSIIPDQLTDCEKMSFPSPPSVRSAVGINDGIAFSVQTHNGETIHRLSISATAYTVTCPKGCEGNKNRQFLNAFPRILTCIGINKKTYPWISEIAIFSRNSSLFFHLLFLYRTEIEIPFLFFPSLLILARIYTYLIRRINYTRLPRNIFFSFLILAPICIYYSKDQFRDPN